MFDQKTLHQTVCQANNEAASKLVLGDCHSAKEGFRTTLNWLKTGKRPQMTETWGHKGAPIPIPIGWKTYQYPLRLPFQSDDEVVSPHNTFCYYNRIMMVHEDETDDVILCMVILFNLANTYHHLGLMDPGQDSVKKALQLYKMALAASQQREDFDRREDFVRLLLLATFTNMGHIYSHIGNPYGEKVCQQQLVAVMAGTSLFLDAEEARKFQINACQRAEWAPAA